MTIMMVKVITNNLFGGSDVRTAQYRRYDNSPPARVVVASR